MKKILSTLSLLILVSGCGITTRNAHYDGYALSTEENGLIFRAKNVYTKTDLASSNEDIWCVIDESVLKQIDNASKNKIRIRLTYHSELITALWRCQITNNIIDSVEEIK